jgi:hypothetical protein
MKLSSEEAGGRGFHAREKNSDGIEEDQSEKNIFERREKKQQKFDDGTNCKHYSF